MKTNTTNLIFLGQEECRVVIQESNLCDRRGKPTKTKFFQQAFEKDKVPGSFHPYKYALHKYKPMWGCRSVGTVAQLSGLALVYTFCCVCCSYDMDDD
jgi:hypothetical protein